MRASEKQRGFLVVLVGPGGAGKNAILDALIQRMGGLQKLVTATTRAPRAGESEGRDHYFVTREQFEQWRDEGRLLEHTEVTPGKFYGIVREKVDAALNNGIDLIGDIEVHGAEALMAAYPGDVVPIFVTVADTPEAALPILRQRMLQRGDDAELVQQRLNSALDIEFPFAERTAGSVQVIINSDGQMENSIRHIQTIILRERERHGRLS